MATGEPSIRSGSKGSQGDRRNTEAGLSKAQSETLARVEKQAGNLDKEVLTIIDKNGNILKTYQGNQSNVSTDDEGDMLSKDAVLTHNHPAYLLTSMYGDTLATQVGNTLSPNDVAAAIAVDAKEIRAATKGGYVFSLKRPANGWGNHDPEDIMNEMSYLTYKENDKLMYRLPNETDYYKKRDSRIETADYARTSILSRHNALKVMAKKYGWSYTRRRWKD